MNANESAFPCPVGHIECAHPTGLTKREYFAGQIISGPTMRGVRQKDRVRRAVELTDALIAELLKEKQP